MAVTVPIWVNGRQATAVVCAGHQDLQVSGSFLRGMSHLTELSTVTLPIRLEYSKYDWDVEAVRDALFSVPRNSGCGCHDVRISMTYLRSLGLSLGINTHDKRLVGVRESSSQCELGLNTMGALVRKRTREPEPEAETHGEVRILEIKRDRTSQPAVLHVRGADAEPESPIAAVPRVSVKLNGRTVYALADTGASLSVVNPSFLRNLGIEPRPYEINAEMADGRIAKSFGLVDLLVEVCGYSRVMPFCVFEELGGRAQEAILGCNVLGCSGLMVDAANCCLLHRGGSQTGLERCEDNLDGCREPRPLAIGELFNWLIRQQIGGGVTRLIRLHMLQAEEAPVDLSNWEFSWDEIPFEQFDICDEQTAGAYGKVLQLIRRHEALFDSKNRPMGGARVEPFRIELLPGTRPRFRSQYRYAPKEMEYINTQVEEMLAQGVIRPSKSPWSSPVVLAKKDGGTAYRLCNDLRGVQRGFCRG